MNDKEKLEEIARLLDKLEKIREGDSINDAGVRIAEIKKIFGKSSSVEKVEKVLELIEMLENMHITHLEAMEQIKKILEG